MMKKTIFVTIILSLLVLLSSCNGEIKSPDDSWESIFLQYWNEMNTEFVHFSDNTSYDWDKVYEKYLPLFQALDFSKKSDSLTAFKYFKEIAYNAHDYHYNLSVSDAFGQKLSCSPAILQKYAANGGDIMEFPDVIVTDEEGEQHLASIENPEDYCDGDRSELEYQQAIPSIYEVRDLMGDNASGKGSDWGNFHTTEFDTLEGDFGKAYYGYTFSSLKKTDGLSDKDKATIDEWNEVVGEISLTRFFYGVTDKDKVLYIYFNKFGNEYFLSGILVKEDGELSESERAEIRTDSDLRRLREKTRSLIKKTEDASLIENANLRDEIKERVEGVKELYNMYKALLGAVTDGKCTINGKEREVKGIAVDLRGNTGGSVNFLFRFWGAFFPYEDVLIGYARYKSGYSRYEYTPWTSFNLEKKYCNKNIESAYSKPLCVIVNGYSVSCSELSCVIARELSNAHVIGHQTYGGTCPLTSRKVYNAGPFKSTYLYVYTSTFQYVDKNKKSIEGIGIIPDEESELSTSKDYAFIKALDWIAGR